MRTGTTLAGRLVVYDALDARFREVKVPRDPECAVCGDRPTIDELVEMEEACAPPAGDEITVRELDRLRRSEPGLQIVDVRNPAELEIAALDGAIVIPMPELPARRAELDPSDIGHAYLAAVGIAADDNVRELGRVGQSTLSLDVDLEGVAIGVRRLAQRAGGDLDVLGAKCIDDFARSQI